MASAVTSAMESQEVELMPVKELAFSSEKAAQDPVRQRSEVKDIIPEKPAYSMWLRANRQ